MQHIQAMRSPWRVRQKRQTKVRKIGNISLERVCEIDDNREGRAMFFKINYKLYSDIQYNRERFSKNVQYPLFPTPPFSTSTPPSSLTQHLVLLKTDHWISRIKSTCREHSILGTSLNYLGLFTTLPYRGKA